MAIQDTFIGNLRAAQRGAQTGLRAVPQKGVSEGYRSAPMAEPRTSEQDMSAKAGSLYAQTPEISNNSSFNVKKIAQLPQTEREWRAFTDGLDDFNALLDEYDNEPSQAKRISLLERNSQRFSNSPRLSRYIEIMYADEKSNQDGSYNDFNYRNVKPGISDAINEVMSFRVNRA